MLDWILAHPNVLAAGSTVLLAFFAAVQIALEVRRSRHVSKSALIEVQGPAWLARRTLERAVFEAQTSKDVFYWLRIAGEGAALDRIERQLLSVLELGAIGEGRAARAAEAAFENFLAYADRVNEATAMPWPAGGGIEPTSDARNHAQGLAKEAVKYLRDAVDQLSQLAPRRPHEPVLPARDDVRFLSQDDDGKVARE